MFSDTLLNTLLAFVPSAVIATRQTTIISASITAYSTAVGPSSARKNRIVRSKNLLMDLDLSRRAGTPACCLLGATDIHPAHYEPPILLLTDVNVAFAFVPRAVMATRHTTMMSASITAYSTAVGPSSRFRKLTTC